MATRKPATTTIATPKKPRGEKGTQATGGESEGEAPKGTEPSRTFGGLTPSEAVALRWERERARQATDAEAQVHDRADEAIIVRTTVQTGAIISRLAADARKGNTQAARELRAWLNEVQVETDTDASSLDKRTRQALMARLLDEVDEEARHARCVAGPDGRCVVCHSSLEQANPTTSRTQVDTEAVHARGEGEAGLDLADVSASRAPVPRGTR